jgi:putative type II/III system pilus formation protein
MTHYVLLAAAILAVPLLCGDASAQQRPSPRGIVEGSTLAARNVDRRERPSPRGIVVRQLQPAEIVRLGIGITATFTTDRPFKTIHIVDPNIVDAVAQTDRSAILVPKSPGASGLTVFDEDSGSIAELLIVVDEIGLVGRVKIHNQARLGSMSIYRCGDTIGGCELVNEQIMKAPAPVLTANERREIIVRRAPGVGITDTFAP